MSGSKQVKALKAALADFRAADAALWKIIREKPAGEAGRLAFEAALRATVEAGARLAEARRPRLVTDGGERV